MSPQTATAPDSELLANLFPIGTTRDARGLLTIGGAAVDELAADHATPLYVYDEATIRAQCRGYTRALASVYPHSLVVYAGKAYVDPEFLRVVASEGLGLDAVSSGELRVAQLGGMPLNRTIFHGNNKLPGEIEFALEAGVGRVVIDSLDELDLIVRIAAKRGRAAPVMLRVTPGVQAHTHEYIRTGAVDSKFGLGIESGAAEEGLARAMAAPELDLTGVHAHIGSQIFEVAPYTEAVEIVLDFVQRTARRHGFELRDFSPGGGVGARYTLEDDPPDPARVVEAVADPLVGRGFEPAPRLLLEPGRSIAARAGVAVYRVGSIKEIPGVRTYVAVDGGMADNIRPALYEAAYCAVVANRKAEGEPRAVTVAGRYCESGDVLLRDAALPPLQLGDLLAVPAAGAYHMSMGSNYNMVGRPAVVMVRGGSARVTRRRETDDDLMLVFP